jgi:hypothetical protein
MRAIIFGIVVLLGCALCTAQRVYLFGTGIPERDAALADALRAHGLQVTLGVPYQAFDGSQNLSPFQVAVLAGSGYQDDMPLAGQQVLLDWVASGRGLVTLEWSIWAVESWNRFLILRQLFPATYKGSTLYRTAIQYQLQVNDAVLGRGLGTRLALGEGHEAYLQPKRGATLYYSSDYPRPSAAGVVGWQYGDGRVMSLSVAPGYALNPLPQNPAFRQLLTNAVQWAANRPCSPSGGDVDGNGCVDDADLLTVLFEFGATGATAADVNCDSVVDDADLLEVLFAFGSGC